MYHLVATVVEGGSSSLVHGAVLLTIGLGKYQKGVSFICDTGVELDLAVIVIHVLHKSASDQVIADSVLVDSTRVCAREGGVITFLIKVVDDYQCMVPDSAAEPFHPSCKARPWIKLCASRSFASVTAS